MFRTKAKLFNYYFIIMSITQKSLCNGFSQKLWRITSTEH